MPAKNRLKKEKDFENVFKNGKGFKEGCLYLKVAKNDLAESRVGFIVGKNFSKKAVERNKIKRRLREIVKSTKIKDGFDVAVVVTPKTENNYDKLKEIINKLFKKANIND